MALQRLPCIHLLQTLLQRHHHVWKICPQLHQTLPPATCQGTGDQDSARRARRGDHQQAPCQSEPLIHDSITLNISESNFTGCPERKIPRYSPLSETENEHISKVYSINTIIGNRSSSPRIIKTRSPHRKTVRRDNRGELALFLPNLAVYNHRSIWKKLNSFCLEFDELGMGGGFPF